MGLDGTASIGDAVSEPPTGEHRTLLSHELYV
jgi:hypothetical protein